MDEKREIDVIRARVVGNDMVVDLCNGSEALLCIAAVRTMMAIFGELLERDAKKNIIASDNIVIPKMSEVESLLK